MPTDGFRQTPPALAKLFPGVDVRLDLDMDSLGDQSGYGNNGTPSAAGVSVAPGAYGNVARKFIGSAVAGLSRINCGNAASTLFAGAMDFTLGGWFYQRSAAFSDIVGRTNGGATTGIELLVWNNGATAILDSGTPAWRSSAAGVGLVINNRWTWLTGTKKGTTYRVFVDGLQVYTATGSANIASNAANTCYVGYDSVPRSADGSIDQPIICAQALSPEQIYRLYQAASARPLFYDNFSQYPVDFAARSVGATCGPFRVLSNSLQMIADSAGKNWVHGKTVGINVGIVDTPVEQAYGTWEFDLKKLNNGNELRFNFALSAKAAYTDASQNGYSWYSDGGGGGWLYVVTAGVVGGMFRFSAAGSGLFGNSCSIRIVRRIGGNTAVYIKGGIWPDWALLPADFSTNPYLNNAHTTGKYVSVGLASSGVTATDDRISNIKQWLTCRRPSSFPWEFSTGTYSGVVSSSKVWKNQLTAGITYLPKDYDYLQGRSGFRTMKNFIYKGAAGSILDTIFGEELLGSAVATQYGYVSRIRANGTVDWIRTDNGVETVVTSSAAGFIADTTEYERRITRTDAGLWTVAFRGGAYADWTVATSAVGMIYQTANYLLSDFDVGDRETAPYFSDGVES